MKYKILILCFILFSQNVFATDVYLSLSAHGQRMDLGIGGFIPKTASIEEEL